MIHTGRPFLQIPGPTNVPDRVLRAMDFPVIDHRSAEFASLGAEVLDGVRKIFQTASPVVMYPASGTGAWEAALVNTLSAGDRGLLFQTGHFSNLWRQIAEQFGLKIDYVPRNCRSAFAASLLGLAGNAEAESHRLDPVPAAHQLALRFARGHAQAAERGAIQYFQAARASRGSETSRGTRLGSGNCLRRPSRI